MRKSREETARTRERIIEAASEEIRANGVAESGLAELMKAAGLTDGGFYKHFGSKDQLVAESLGRAFDQVLGELQSSIKGKRRDAALATLVGEYLSSHGRDEVEKSCPLSAIGTELRRADSGTAAVVRSGMERLTSIVAHQITGVSGRQAKARARGMVAAMVGGPGKKTRYSRKCARAHDQKNCAITMPRNLFSLPNLTSLTSCAC